MNRREFIRSFVVTAALVGTAAAGLLELGSLVQKSQNSELVQATIQQSTSIQGSTVANGTSQSSSVAVPSGYSLIASLSQLSGKTYAYFSHPTFGSSLLVSIGGQWKAFSATCTHRPCTVQYQNSVIYCPCHDGTFSASNGNVEGGPPPIPLPEYSVLVQGTNLYVGNSQIN
jgi:Rieske Fe-S protein